MKQNSQIDIGTGDIVRPRLLDIELLHDGKPIFEDSITLLSYPKGYIFSEKFEAIIYLGNINGRMKDFYDCYQLTISESINKEKLKQALKEIELENVVKEINDLVSTLKISI